MKFDVETFAGVVNDAQKVLKKRTLGGVENGSALEAIQKGVSKALNLGEEAVGKIQQELQQFQNKTAQEMVEMTSKNDKVVFETKNAAQKAIKEVKEEATNALKATKAIKSSEKALANGNKEIRKVNKNGAVMVKEVNPQGVTVRSEVTTLAGDYRKTVYDPVSGKPVKTFTDVNGDKLIEYKDGTFPSVKSVNNKKMKQAKPTLVNQTQPKPGDTAFVGEGALKFDRIYSDGSKETINRVTSKGEVVRTSVNKYDSKGNVVSQMTTFGKTGDKRVELYDPVTNSRTEIEQYTLGNGKKFKTMTKTKYDDTLRHYTEVSGEQIHGDNSIKYTKLKDEFGLFTEKYKAKITHPKGSKRPPTELVGTRDEIFKAFNDSLKLHVI